MKINKSHVSVINYDTCWSIPDEELSNKLGFKVQLHRCRSTYATLLYSRSKDVKLVQFQLGHSSSDVTDKYIQRSLKSVKDQMDSIGRLF